MKNLETIVSEQLFARTINNILWTEQPAYFIFCAEISIYASLAEPEAAKKRKIPNERRTIKWKFIRHSKIKHFANTKTFFFFCDTLIPGGIHSRTADSDLHGNLLQGVTPCTLKSTATIKSTLYGIVYVNIIFWNILYDVWSANESLSKQRCQTMRW